MIRGLLTFAFLSVAAVAQSAPLTLPPGTQLPVSIPGNLPMKAGEPIRAELLYPVYAENQLVLPAHTVVTGTVVSLTPDHRRRVRARLGADFTPYHIPVVRFDSILLPSGVALPVSTGPVTDGAPVYRLVAPPPVKGGLFAHLFAEGKSAVHDRLQVITAPDKGDRLKQFVYSQLPYHPERIAKSTAWTAETSFELTVPALPERPAAAAVSLPAPDPDKKTPWIVQSYLTTPISSETSKPGDKISATVAEPIFNPDGSVAVPEGSILTGEVTQAHPARKLARDGELRFSFRQLQLPGQQPQNVRASLTGADSSSASQLAMDSEGQVRPKPQDKIIVPLILIALAGRPLDRDRGDNMLGKDAVASNSLGLIAFIIGTAAQQPYVAAGIGYYGAARSIYERIFAKGKPVAFVKDTRVVIQTTATRSAAMKADATMH